MLFINWLIVVEESDEKKYVRDDKRTPEK